MGSYMAVPHRVEAYQFLGWDDAITIFDVFGYVLYVHRGYDSYLRQPNERDDRGRVKEDANEFLMVKLDHGVYRVDLGDYVNIDQFGTIKVGSQTNFKQTFKSADSEGEN